jgi:hypothetical protein
MPGPHQGACRARAAGFEAIRAGAGRPGQAEGWQGTGSGRRTFSEQAPDVRKRPLVVRKRAEDVRPLLRQLRDYVQTVADATPDNAAALIQSAAMNVRKVSLAGKRVFSVKQGALSGAVSILAPSAGSRASHEWEMSIDGGKTWQALPPTMPPKTTASGLQPATTYAFRYRSVTKAGASDWSQPIAIVVK